jgi:hypothetical protein
MGVSGMMLLRPTQRWRARGAAVLGRAVDWCRGPAQSWLVIAAFGGALLALVAYSAALRRRAEART